MYALTEYPAIVFILNKWICALIEKDAAVEIARSGILPTLAQALRCKSSLSCQVALVVAEMAREGRILLMVFDKRKPDKFYNISPTNDKIQLPHLVDLDNFINPFGRFPQDGVLQFVMELQMYIFPLS